MTILKGVLMPGNIIIKNASQLVTCSGFKAKFGREMADLHIIEDGTVVIRDGIIQHVGKTETVLKGLTDITGGLQDVVQIDAGNKAVLPGFIDSHTHFVFGGYRADEFCRRLRGESYIDILKRGGGILSTVDATRKASLESLIRTGQKRLNTMLEFGITTVEGKSGYGLDKDTEIKQLEAMASLDNLHPVDIVTTFLGAHAIPVDYRSKSDDFIRFLIDMVMPEVAERKLAEFCDVFCEKNVFSVKQSKTLLTHAREMGFKLKIHADEMTQLGGAELAASLKAVSADHLLCASDRGIKMMAEAGVMATLLPATAFCLKEPYAKGRQVIDRGSAVALATDLNPGSAFSGSIPLTIALAAIQMNMTPEEAITAFTINAAAALDRAKEIGSIDVGKKGDLVILEYPSYQFIPYHTGVSCVEKVIKNGQLIFDKDRETCFQT